MFTTRITKTKSFIRRYHYLIYLDIETLKLQLNYSQFNFKAVLKTTTKQNQRKYFCEDVNFYYLLY